MDVDVVYTQKVFDPFQKFKKKINISKKTQASNNLFSVNFNKNATNKNKKKH